MYHTHQVVHLADEGTHALQLLNYHRTRANPQEILQLTFKGEHIILLELRQQQLLELHEQFLGIREMGTILDQKRRILEPIEQKLQTFAGAGVLAFVLEYLRQDVLHVVQETAVLILLD